MMEVKAKFQAGPLHGQWALTVTLDQVKVFFEERTREVNVYVHQGDGDYLWSPDMSRGLTAKYDAALAKFGANPPTLRFPDVDPFPRVELFSEVPIDEPGEEPVVEPDEEPDPDFLPPDPDSFKPADDKFKKPKGWKPGKGDDDGGLA